MRKLNCKIRRGLDLHKFMWDGVEFQKKVIYFGWYQNYGVYRILFWSNSYQILI